MIINTLIMLILCGALTTLMCTYIFILGSEKDHGKFFGLKCGIMVLGIICMFLFFRDMTDPLLQEFSGGILFKMDTTIELDSFILFILSVLLGIFGQIKGVKWESDLYNRH